MDWLELPLKAASQGDGMENIVNSSKHEKVSPSGAIGREATGSLTCTNMNTLSTRMFPEVPQQNRERHARIAGAWGTCAAC